MPRIIAGKARGIRLNAPEGMDTRPTADSRKEAIFSSIAFEIPQSRFLDLFSGSGAAGLEALSRGAQEAVLVESCAKAAKVIQENINKTHLTQAQLLVDDVYHAIKLLADQGRQFDLIFLDPPYHQGHEERVLEALASRRLLSCDGMIVIESAADTIIQFPACFTVVKNKQYRITQFTLLRYTEENAV